LSKRPTIHSEQQLSQQKHHDIEESIKETKHPSDQQLKGASIKVIRGMEEKGFENGQKCAMTASKKSETELLQVGRQSYIISSRTF